MEKSRFAGRTTVACWVAAGMLFVYGCNKSDNAGSSPEPGKSARGRSPIQEVMIKMTKGGQSLTRIIPEELKADPPPWDKIIPQSKECAELTASLTRLDPPRGDKESWTTLTEKLSKSASNMQKAAEAKDKDGVLAAHKQITGSCKECHDAHRGRGPRG